MRTKLLPSHTLAAVALMFAFVASDLRAQSDPLYIQFSPSAVKGALYHPDPPQPGVTLQYSSRIAPRT